MKPIQFILIVSAVAMFMPFGAARSDEPHKPGTTQSGASKDDCCNVDKAAAGPDSAASNSAPSLVDLEDINVLRERFNADHGHPRLVALLSPVCPGCIKSAKLIRSELLEKYKESDLKAYVVWLPMVPGDARDRWDAEILKDTRATHYWNGSRSIGKWFSEKVQTCEPLGPVAWDVVYIFDANTKWDGDELTAETCPTPVYAYPEDLAKVGEKLLGKHDAAAEKP